MPLITSWIPRSSDAQNVSPAVERKDTLLAEIASHWHEITARHSRPRPRFGGAFLWPLELILGAAIGRMLRALVLDPVRGEHCIRLRGCPLLGVEQITPASASRSAIEPSETLAVVSKPVSALAEYSF